MFAFICYTVIIKILHNASLVNLFDYLNIELSNIYMLMHTHGHALTKVKHSAEFISNRYSANCCLGIYLINTPVKFEALIMYRPGIDSQRRHWEFYSYALLCYGYHVVRLLIHLRSKFSYSWWHDFIGQKRV